MIALLLYVLFTIIYFVTRYYAPKYNKVSNTVYAIAVIMSQLFSNLSLIKELCGEASYGKATLVTIIPWLLIFGLLYVMLLVFPGWKQPFSNTFGYLAAKLMGINGLLFNILKTPEGTNTRLDKNLQKIYTNPALFINQVTTDNFDTFFNESKYMFKETINKKDSPLMKSFKNMIRMKELVSEFIWYLLTGLLVTTVSYNAIAESSCNQSVEEMKKRHKEYEQNVKKQQEESENAPPERVYYVKD